MIPSISYHPLKEEKLTLVRLKDRFQITIPKKIRRQLNCQIGDLFDVELKEGNLFLTPHQLVAKPFPAPLNPQLREILQTLRRKIELIAQDNAHSTGLTPEETALAVKTGLILEEEAWWWREEWQSKERSTPPDKPQQPLESKVLLEQLDRSRREG